MHNSAWRCVSGDRSVVQNFLVFLIYIRGGHLFFSLTLW
ncbi:hypothetical protein NSE_0660 [Neorickettsia sennetsu str. Miyayama]|uniref:Uncharacterized protein n=1 Tax=Ehrlichia sennetsu (strain ATCC VR-367 / Miyayama) TaxID=222891 RepID=Q2GDA8_EHRS3|nr:hypothetical protein NSE_0660 [Neorickettsia sennetsu str. Miyayama]